MKNRISENDEAEDSDSYSSNYSLKNDYKERRRLEMKRRLGLLNYRRERLERELGAIEISLFTLNKQIQSENACCQTEK